MSKGKYTPAQWRRAASKVGALTPRIQRQLAIHPCPNFDDAVDEAVQDGLANALSADLDGGPLPTGERWFELLGLDKTDAVDCLVASIVRAIKNAYEKEAIRASREPEVASLEGMAEKLNANAPISGDPDYFTMDELSCLAADDPRYIEIDYWADIQCALDKARLTRKQRDALSLYVEGLPAYRIGEAMGITRQAAEKLVARAKMRLPTELLALCIAFRHRFD